MKAEQFFTLSLDAAYVCLALAGTTGLLRIRKLNTDQRLLFIVILLAIAVEAAGRILWEHSVNNLFLYHLYSVAEFTLLAWVYQNNMSRAAERTGIKIILVGFVLFAIVNTVFFQPLTAFNTNASFLESILLILLAIWYFYTELRDLRHRNLMRVPMFWINVSVMTYFSGALVLFHLANELIPQSLKVRGVVWGVHALFNIVHYVLYTIALSLRNPGETCTQPAEPTKRAVYDTDRRST